MSGFASYKLRLERSLCDVHVLDFKGQGELPPVLLVHGLSSCAADFYPIVRSLQAECQRVVALDLPGHGMSNFDVETDIETMMIDSVRLTIEKLGIKGCVLIGNSLGGFISIRVASQYKGHVRGLVLLSPAGAPNTDEELKRMKKLFTMETITDASSFVDQVDDLRN